MNPNEAQPGLEPPVVERRMDPRVKWALLPLMALVLLAGYFLGTEMAAPKPVTTPPPAPPPVAAPPPKKPLPPRGKITITEVPTQIAPPPAPAPVVTPAPAPAPAPQPKPPRKPPVQEEPPVILPPEPGTDTSGTGDNTAPGDENPNPNPDGGDNANTTRPAGEGDRDAALLNNPALEYPSSAYEEGAQGTVRVAYTITEAGSVENVRVQRSSGDDRLDRAAVDYVSRLRYRPAQHNGQAASVTMSRTVNFSLR